MRHKTSWALALLAICLFGVVLAPADVRATESAYVSGNESVTDAALRLDRARDLEAFVLLREIWESWQDADPRKVEEALLVTAANTKQSPQLRAYARHLAAYARIRRGDQAGAERTFQELGFVTDWMIVGPFDNEGKSGFLRDFEPDVEHAAPVVPGRAFSGKERPVRFRESPPVFRWGWVDFGSLLRPREHVCAFATTFVEGKDKPSTITLWVGAEGAVRVRFNGQVAVEDAAYRHYDADRLAASVVLEPGHNRITVKACGAETAPMFSLRIADEKGQPLSDLRISSDVRASELAQEVVQRVLEKNAPLPKHPTALRAPIDFVRRTFASEASSAADSELAARYLVLTDGDDETVHQARDLASRAAKKGPTVRRHLLAAELAEDRNAAAVSLAEASRLAKDDDIAVLLARAAHLRTGPTPRAAFELYDRVLSLDPDNLIALRGRVELYNAAGLRRSALALLEDAAERNPQSVLLLNMLASERAALGRDALAREAEDRYAALRADDTSYQRERMELALNRRNTAATEHWLSRLVSTERDGSWVYRVAARVHRGLGQHERALSDLEFAHSVVPEDVGVLQHEADLHGRMGDRERQLALLEEVLRLQPQNVDVRKYVEHIEPPEERSDEKYAMPAEQFLSHRHAPADGNPRRTLRDLTVSTVYQNGLSSQFRQIVFQPLTDASAALSRQYAFQYQADRQRVELLGAKVYRGDGSVDEAIESGEGAANDPSISMYTSARTFYVQFPRLEPGDVVELRYRIDDVTVRNEYGDYYGEVVYLQSDEPVQNAEYVLATPKGREILVDSHVAGLEQTTSEGPDGRVHRFFAGSVPALRPEASMPPWSEVLGFVHVSTYKNWDDLGAWYWGLVKDQLDLDDETRKLAKEITKDKKTDLEKVKAIYGWVIKNTRYVALEFGIYGYKPRRCVQTINRGWGDCKDKATVIVTLLREVGVNANLVILRTGMRGDFRSKLASLAPFDHAIAYVPSLDLYLDGTAEYTGIGELPTMDRGALGLLVLDGKAKLVKLPNEGKLPSFVSRTADVTLAKDGSATVALDYAVSGALASGYRARYEAEGTRRDRLASDLGRELPGLSIAEGGITASDLSDVEAPVTLAIKGKVPQFARPEGATMSLPVTASVDLTTNFAALSSRKQDVVLTGFSERRETVRVHLPRGATVDAAPPNVSGKSRFGEYEVKYTEEAGVVTVESRVNLTMPRITPADYAAFRAFCGEVDRAMAHRLSIKP